VDAILVDTNDLQTNQSDWVTATGFSTLTQADIRTAVGLASANLDTQLADLPTVAEFEARTLVAAAYFDPAADTVAHVTLVDTTTTNTDMRGTDSAATASALATAQADLDILTGSDGVTLATTQPNYAPATAAALAAAQVDLDAITDTGVTCVALTSAAIADVWSTDTLTESYAANGAAGTPAQLVYAIQQYLTMFTISGTSYAVKKLDGSTTAFTVTLNDGTTPTAATRS
jgi:hypothetical protein